MSDKTAGQRLYEAFWFGGTESWAEDIAPWSETTADTREHWHRGAAAVMPQPTGEVTADERKVWLTAFGYRLADDAEPALARNFADRALDDMRNTELPAWVKVTKP